MERIVHLIGALLTVLTFALVGPAAAQEYCVACSEPNAVYRCIIDNAKPGGGQPLQMLCINTLAQQGGHATCGIKRGTVFDCNGPVKHIPWVAVGTPEEARPVQTAPPPPPKPEQSAGKEPTTGFAPAPGPATKPGPDDPPQTVLELAKRANDQTLEQMKKAGDTVKKAGETVKDATKKSWDCMVSFFTKC
jgi:hypothetical protein